MKKIINASIIAVAIAATPFMAFAFTAPQTTIEDGVTVTNPHTANLSRAATLTASFSANENYGEQSYLTVGDVNDGQIGYGIYVKGQWAYLVANDGAYRSQFPIALIAPGRKVTVSITYVPGSGLYEDTFSAGESRGVMYHWEPMTGYQQGTEFYAAAIHTTLSVNSWNYTQN